MAVPAHKTEYFIIENSNLQKKANTPKNVDLFCVDGLSGFREAINAVYPFAGIVSYTNSQQVPFYRSSPTFHSIMQFLIFCDFILPPSPIGPDVRIIYLQLRLYPFATLTIPSSKGAISPHSLSSSAPAAKCIASSTPLLSVYIEFF